MPQTGEGLTILLGTNRYLIPAHYLTFFLYPTQPDPVLKIIENQVTWNVGYYPIFRAYPTFQETPYFRKPEISGTPKNTRNIPKYPSVDRVPGYTWWITIPTNLLFFNNRPEPAQYRKKDPFGPEDRKKILGHMCLQKGKFSDVVSLF